VSDFSNDPSFEALRYEVKGIKDVVFGYWEGGERVAGLVEQTNAMIREMKERDVQHAELVERLTSSAWSIAKPLFAGIVVLIVVGVLNALTHVDVSTVQHVLTGGKL
jgi:hypothetical protein